MLCLARNSTTGVPSVSSLSPLYFLTCLRAHPSFPANGAKLLCKLASNLINFSLHFLWSSTQLSQPRVLRVIERAHVRSFFCCARFHAAISSLCRLRGLQAACLCRRPWRLCDKYQWGGFCSFCASGISRKQGITAAVSGRQGTKWPLENKRFILQCAVSFLNPVL